MFNQCAKPVDHDVEINRNYQYDTNGMNSKCIHGSMFTNALHQEIFYRIRP